MVAVFRVGGAFVRSQAGEKAANARRECEMNIINAVITTWDGDMGGSTKVSDVGTMDFRRAAVRRAVPFDGLLPVLGQAYADELVVKQR